jgi:hypothetical protein
MRRGQYMRRNAKQIGLDRAAHVSQHIAGCMQMFGRVQQRELRSNVGQRCRGRLCTAEKRFFAGGLQRLVGNCAKAGKRGAWRHCLHAQLRCPQREQPPFRCAIKGSELLDRSDTQGDHQRRKQQHRPGNKDACPFGHEKRTRPLDAHATNPTAPHSFNSAAAFFGNGKSKPCALSSAASPLELFVSAIRARSPNAASSSSRAGFP